MADPREQPRDVFTALLLCYLGPASWHDGTRVAWLARYDAAVWIPTALALPALPYREGIESELVEYMEAGESAARAGVYRAPQCSGADPYWSDDEGANRTSAKQVTHWRPMPAPPR